MRQGACAASCGRLADVRTALRSGAYAQAARAYDAAAIAIRGDVAITNFPRDTIDTDALPPLPSLGKSGALPASV